MRMKLNAARSFIEGKPLYQHLDHCELAYRVVGSGEPLLLVHGYPLSGLTFRNVVPLLSQYFTCYIPDLPGLGETEWTDATDFKFAAQAETLKKFIDALGLSSYSILAHDTGGTIARRLAIIDKDRIRALALIGTEIPGHRPPWIPFFQKIARPNKNTNFQFLMSKRWFRHSSAAFGGCFEDPSLIDGEFYDVFIAPVLASERRMSGQTHFLLGIDWKLVDSLKTEHAQIIAPTLLIWGEDDPVFPVSEARLMVKQLGNCKGFVTVPKAKLFVQEEKPEIVARLVLEFMIDGKRFEDR
jgi:haloalkane dehalogenase